MTTEQGTVLRSHAGGYLVYAESLSTVLQCQARGRLKKEQVSIYTGDRVELSEVELEFNRAVISACLPRTNLLSRPPLANVDQVVIVQAVHQPDWNPILCDRYIVHFQLELDGARPILCFNKADLADQDEINALRSIYEPLGYFVTIVSAATGLGVSELHDLLKGKISVLTGQSGVGKSTLLNHLDPALKLKVGIMENEFGVGRHTTTSSELYELGKATDGEKPTWIADTPGFNLSQFSHPEPSMVAFQFPELIELVQLCKYSNCLHTIEQGCNVRANLEKLSAKRYESYCAIVQEAQTEYELFADRSSKTELHVKDSGGNKKIPKLKGKLRATSRNTENQNLRASMKPDKKNSALDQDS